MKIAYAVLAGAVCLLPLDHPLTAQSIPGTDTPTTLPAAVNLDVAPDTPPDPEQAQEEAVASEGIEQPQSFHDGLLQLHPDRGASEQTEALAFLFPDVYARTHPKTPDQIRAEALAAHAILNPQFPTPPGLN